MASTGSKWLIGCGIGCGVIVLLVIIIATVGYFLIKDTVDTFKETEASMDRVEELYGRVEDYCPDTNGTIPANRIEAFLAVRDSLSMIRGKWEEGLNDFSNDIQEVETSKKTFWKVLGIIRKGVGAIPEIAEFYTSRNEALLDAHMGLGEYYYMYVLIYYSWLGHSPEDGPNFNFMGDDHGRHTYRFNSEDAEERKEQEQRVGEDRRDRIIRIARGMIRPMLNCQLEVLEEKGIHNTWRRALETEINALKVDNDRLPWQNGLPRMLDESLKPFRDRLEASYSALLNALEMGSREEW